MVKTLKGKFKITDTVNYKKYDIVKKVLKRCLKMEGVQKYVEGLKNSAKIEYIDTELSPEVLGKKIEEALPKQIELEKKLSAPKKSLADKFKKNDKEKETEVEPK